MVNEIKIFTCLRCRWKWGSRMKKPISCPKCKTRSWNVPKKLKGGKK